jgi:hypothetical protein
MKERRNNEGGCCEQESESILFGKTGLKAYKSWVIAWLQHLKNFDVTVGEIGPVLNEPSGVGGDVDAAAPRRDASRSLAEA